MTNAKSGTLDTGANIQYLCTLVRGEALRHFDSFSDDVERTETLTAENIIKGLALYSPPINLLFKKPRNAPRNEETARSKRKTLCGALD